jgi:hypothetical protein
LSLLKLHILLMFFLNQYRLEFSTKFVEFGIEEYLKVVLEIDAGLADQPFVRLGILNKLVDLPSIHFDVLYNKMFSFLSLLSLPLLPDCEDSRDNFTRERAVVLLHQVFQPRCHAVQVEFAVAFDLQDTLSDFLLFPQ